MRTNSLKIKISLLVLSALVGLLILGVVSTLQARKDMEDARRLQIKSLVEAAYNTILHHHAQQVAGKMTLEQAQKAAAEAVLVQRYGGPDGKTEYLYAWTLEGVGVAHIKADFIGQNMMEKVKDGQGRYTLKDIAAAVRSNPDGAFVDTAFPRPGSSELVSKLQYARQFQPWGWMIGTGVYMDDIDVEFRKRLMFDFGIIVLIVVVVGALGALIARGVFKQVGGEPGVAIALMQRASDGDLTVDVGQAASGSMLASLGQMVSSIRVMVGDIRQRADALAHSASEISRSSEAVARSAHEQSESTAAMAAGIEEMTVSINHISESAKATEDDSVESARLAEEGRQRVELAGAEIRQIATAVTDAATQIQHLEGRTREIASIASVIRDIADQTNLLALNAAIEAARAGEQGRGFAVVADEVRKLAERTTAATGEIEQMVRGVQADTSVAVEAMTNAIPMVEQGVRAAASAAESLDCIKRGADTTKFRIQEVADATMEQSAASTSIAQKVEVIARTVDETGSAMASSAAAARQLETIAQELGRVVNRFRC